MFPAFFFPSPPPHFSSTVWACIVPHIGHLMQTCRPWSHKFQVFLPIAFLSLLFHPCCSDLSYCCSHVAAFFPVLVHFLYSMGAVKTARMCANAAAYRPNRHFNAFEPVHSRTFWAQMEHARQWCAIWLADLAATTKLFCDGSCYQEIRKCLGLLCQFCDARVFYALDMCFVGPGFFLLVQTECFLLLILSIECFEQNLDVFFPTKSRLRADYSNYAVVVFQTILACTCNSIIESQSKTKQENRQQEYSQFVAVQGENLTTRCPNSMMRRTLFSGQSSPRRWRGPVHSL